MQCTDTQTNVTHAKCSSIAVVIFFYACFRNSNYTNKTQTKTLTVTLLDVHFLSYPSLEDWIKGSKYLRHKLFKPLHKHQPSPSLLWMQLKWKRLSVLMPLLAVVTKIHQRSRSGRPLWGMKVSQQREDQIYFIAWLKSIWCVRCWRWRDGKLLRVSSSPTIEWL